MIDHAKIESPRNQSYSCRKKPPFWDFKKNRLINGRSIHKIQKRSALEICLPQLISIFDAWIQKNKALNPFRAFLETSGPKLLGEGRMVELQEIQRPSSHTRKTQLSGFRLAADIFGPRELTWRKQNPDTYARQIRPRQDGPRSGQIGRGGGPPVGGHHRASLRKQLPHKLQPEACGKRKGPAGVHHSILNQKKRGAFIRIF